MPIFQSGVSPDSGSEMNYKVLDSFLPDVPKSLVYTEK